MGCMVNADTPPLVFEIYEILYKEGIGVRKATQPSFLETCILDEKKRKKYGIYK